MATMDRTTIAELMQRAESLEFGPTRVAILEEAARMADTLADVPLGYQARTSLIEVSQYTGTPEKAIAAFSWCLAEFDRDPSRVRRAGDPAAVQMDHHEHDVVPPGLARPDRGGPGGLHLAGRTGGFGMHAVYKLRWRDAFNRGDVNAAEAAFALWVKTPRGLLSDCAACELNEEIEFLVTWNRDEEAFQRAGPILDGSMSCRSVPHTTIPKLLLPLVRLGRVAEAMPLHLKGYRLIARNPAYINESSSHLRFLALTDNLAEGVTLFETSPWPWRRIASAIASSSSIGRGSCSHRLRANGKTSVRLRLPRSFPGFVESGEYDVSGLVARLESEAIELARRFDERNGTKTLASWLDDAEELEALVTPYSLRSSREASRAGASRADRWCPPAARPAPGDARPHPCFTFFAISC